MVGGGAGGQVQVRCLVLQHLLEHRDQTDVARRDASLGATGHGLVDGGRGRCLQGRRPGPRRTVGGGLDGRARGSAPPTAARPASEWAERRRGPGGAGAAPPGLPGSSRWERRVQRAAGRRIRRGTGSLMAHRPFARTVWLPITPEPPPRRCCETRPSKTRVHTTTRSTSSRLVRPLSTFAMPSSRRLTMPPPRGPPARPRWRRPARRRGARSPASPA